MFDLSGKSALITGASGGIGGSIARALHGCGASVALSGTRNVALETLRAELGERAHVTPADLKDVAAPGRLIELATTEMGAVDILVNNAGLTDDMLVLRMSDESWQNVLDVNLTAAFRLSRAALRGMVQRRWGRIISIASIVGITGNPGPSELCRCESRFNWHVEGIGARSRYPRCNGKQYRARVYRDGNDGRVVRCAAREVACKHSCKSFRNRRRGRSRRGLFGERGSRLHDRPNAACKWRYGDDLKCRMPPKFQRENASRVALVKANKVCYVTPPSSAIWRCDCYANAYIQRGYLGVPRGLS